jgi:Ca2+-binding RTX toxin-like protein
VAGLIGSTHDDVLDAGDAPVVQKTIGTTNIDFGLALWGRAGQDTLIGGTGSDAFVLDSPAASLELADLIMDFDIGSKKDLLVFEKSLNPTGANNVKLWQKTGQMDIDGTMEAVTVIYGSNANNNGVDTGTVYAVLKGTHLGADGTAARMSEANIYIMFLDDWDDNPADLLRNSALETFL